MSRALGLCLLVLSLAACRYDPPGQCSNDTDCPFGRRCTDGVCVGCGSDADCEEWRTCDVSIRQCATRADRCATAKDCEVWEVCNDAHACVPGPDFCESDAACKEWQSCAADHLCKPKDGRCDATADCEEWQVCDTSQTCVAAVGRCAGEDDCANEWETCASDHRCRLGTDRCNTGSDCVGLFPGCDASHACMSSATVSAEETDVVIHGSMIVRTCTYGGLARLDSPGRVLVGFPCIGEEPILLSTGQFVYLDPSEKVLRRFGPDGWERIGGEWKPVLDVSNDTVVATPGCQSGVDGVVPIGGTGRVVYACEGEGYLYYDESGALFSRDHYLQSITFSNVKLAIDSDQRRVVLDSSDQVIEIRGGAPSYFDAPAARVYGSGFRVAGSRVGLWEIDADGSSRQVGTYVAGGSIEPTLDSAGALYSVRTVDGRDLVERRLPDGSVATVVYDEADIPEGANDFSRDSVHPFVLLDLYPLLTPP